MKFALQFRPLRIEMTKHMPNGSEGGVSNVSVNVFCGKRKFQPPVARYFPLAKDDFWIRLFIFYCGRPLSTLHIEYINFFDKLQFTKVEFNRNAHANRTTDAWINFIIDCRTPAHPPNVKQLREIARILFCSEENVNNGVDGKININGNQTHTDTHFAYTFVVAHTISIMTFSSFLFIRFLLLLFFLFYFVCSIQLFVARFYCHLHGAIRCWHAIDFVLCISSRRFCFYSLSR